MYLYVFSSFRFGRFDSNTLWHLSRDCNQKLQKNQLNRTSSRKRTNKIKRTSLISFVDVDGRFNAI